MSKSKKYLLPLGLIALLIIAYFLFTTFSSNSLGPEVINENGIHANYFAKADSKSKATVILIGGGQWGDYWGQLFAEQGFAGLSLPYIGREGLPSKPEAINLEYFEKAIAWLNKQSAVDPGKIIVMGASRNAELSLIIATVFPKLVSGVIAYAPSSVSWSNTVLPYNSDEIKSSWVYQGKDIPYLPMEKIAGNGADKIETLPYWRAGLAKAIVVPEAIIKVEKIHGPILLFSGEDDKVWPSALMANLIEKRIKLKDFKYTFENIKYENAGHIISSHPEINSEPRTGTMKIEGKDYEFEFGGTNEGDAIAKQDAKRRVLEFIEKM